MIDIELFAWYLFTVIANFGQAEVACPTVTCDSSSSPDMVSVTMDVVCLWNWNKVAYFYHQYVL